MQTPKSNGKISNSHNVELTAIGIHEHIFRIFKNHFIRFLTSFSTVFLSLVGIVEVFKYNPQFLSELEFNLALAIVSIITAFVYTAYHYINLCPDGFEDESEEIKKLAHLKRPKWEYKLAKKLLQDRLSKIDSELEDLIKGRKYIEIERQPDIDDYWEWVNIRLYNLERMVDPMLQLLVTDLPIAMGGSKNKPASPIQILNTVEKIKTLYLQTYEFELEGNKIDTPDFFRTLHKYQYGWTHVIRDAINQMFSFLDEVIQHDFKIETTAEIDFEIKVGAPNNLDKFTDELEKKEL
ncbi:hypothetical protein [Fodinibius salsisoli]|uniref:Uncharacterized protein n=1 Tax=Fodinibius salsisoli TaxID=2820877 RepID=A0ABT3PT02_9BACT|nr:hypothetical protein [Fodinibius salsisoli]MCW9708972.1 hypothetical protein [Fodinibius salsisoli]